MDSWILEPLSFAFMQRALIMAILIGLVCAIFSCFLILKGWSLMGDAVSHAVLPGMVLAYIVSIPIALGAFISGLLCAAATGYIKDHSRVKEDAVMGILFSGMFAAGLVMLTKIESELHIMHVLFGNILGLAPRDLIETGAIAALCSGVMLLKRKDFMLYCFDPVQARTIGLNVSLLHFGLLILLALTIVSALKAAGIIMVIAMLIAPGATGFLLSRSFDKMLFIAVTTSLLSCVSGTILSFHWDVATAPLIVIMQFTLFLCAFAVNIYHPAHGNSP